MTEQELIARCRRGERPAQHELYARTSERIYRLLVRMTGSAEAASDLSQETYLRAFSRMGSFDGRSALTTWLYRIAVNEALQHLRRARKTPVPLAIHADSLGSGPDNAGQSVRMDVQAALAALPPTDRAMLLLRYQEGLDYKAIAEATSCAAGTVASRLNRARQRLRELLGTYADGEETRSLPHRKRVER